MCDCSRQSRRKILWDATQKIRGIFVVILSFFENSTPTRATTTDNARRSGIDGSHENIDIQTNGSIKVSYMHADTFSVFIMFACSNVEFSMDR
jgi:hypothetical protein